MEKQINMGDQNTQQVGQNSISQAVQIPTKSKVNYWIISTAIFAVLFFLTVGVYLLTLKKAGESQNFPTPIEQTTNAVPTTTPTVSIEKRNVPQEEKIYQNNQLKISFKYPTDWIVKEENDSSTMGLCDLHSIDPTRYPKASTRFAFCEASGVTPSAAIKFNRLLNIRPESSMNESSYPNPAIQLYYYENKENLSIQDFDNKYLSEAAAGDPISIWSPNYEKVTNPSGISAYYDKEHYCVATCQVYVWSHDNKIFILENFPTGAVNQDKIFHQVFNTLKFVDQN
jgi:hypothetical protein